MKTSLRKLCAVFVIGGWLVTSGAHADDDKRFFEVTVTNLTQGEIFTPIMVASHRPGIKIFELGSTASTDLEILAESGDTQSLSTALAASGALDVVTADDVLLPGHSVTLFVQRNGRNNHVSVASMLVPTNDGFFALNGVRGPRNNQTRTLFSPAYDAGSENNDELCAHIPGPPFICQGEGYNPQSGEGYVYIHPGIQGTGELNAANHDWRNPVARITIRAVKN
jgi:hypothetical protein